MDSDEEFDEYGKPIKRHHTMKSDVTMLATNMVYGVDCSLRDQSIQ